MLKVQTLQSSLKCVLGKLNVIVHYVVLCLCFVCADPDLYVLCAERMGTGLPHLYFVCTDRPGTGSLDLYVPCLCFVCAEGTGAGSPDL